MRPLQCRHVAQLVDKQEPTYLRYELDGAFEPIVPDILPEVFFLLM